MNHTKNGSDKHVNFMDMLKTWEQLSHLLARYSPAELAKMLSVVEAFHVNGKGNLTPPPELSLGFEVGAIQQGVHVMAAVRPTRSSNRHSKSSAVGVFHNQINFASLLIGDPMNGTKARTGELTILLRSVPASAKKFLDRHKLLKNFMHGQVRTNFAQYFLDPLNALVVPRGETEIPTRREAVVWVPIGFATRKVDSEITGLFNQPGLTMGELASLTSASWFGRPTAEPMTGNPKSMFYRAAPFDCAPTKKGMVGSGVFFQYFYLEPNMSGEGEQLRQLLNVDVDLLLHTEIVHGEVKAQLLARARITTPNREQYIRDRLEEFCRVVKPITGKDSVTKAHWAFQPGGAHQEQFGHFPVLDPILLLQMMTSTISKPILDGSIYLGKEPGGTSHLLRIGDSAKGGTQHIALVGTGSSGKTTLMNLLSGQIAGPYWFVFDFNPSELEAVANIAAALGPQGLETRTISNYMTRDHKSREVIKTGLHFLNKPENSTGPAEREWAAFFTTNQGDSPITLEEAFKEQLVPAAKGFLKNIHVPADLPIKIRPWQGCNPELFSAFVILVWTGQDLHGNTLFEGLEDKWANFAGPNDHCIVRFDDVYMIPSDAQDNSFGSLAANKCRSMIWKVLGGFHKFNGHALVGFQAWGDMNLFPAGLVQRFHKVIDIAVNENDGILRRVARIFDSNHLDEVQATIDVDLSNSPKLCNFLTRRRRSAQ